MEELKFEELVTLVEEWAKEKGILKKATPLAQVGKTEEEVSELRESLFAQNNNLEFFVNSKGQTKNTKEEISDAIGDILVTLIIHSKMQNVSITECLIGAYGVISKRTGKMIDGKFVKDKD